MYYRFSRDAISTDEKFEGQMDALTREVGERGKPKALHEGEPPEPAPMPAPRRAPALAPAPAPAVAPAAAPATPAQSFSPSMQLAMSSSPAVVQQVEPALIERLLEQQRAVMVEQREREDRQRQEMERQMQLMREERATTEARLRQELTPAPAQDVVTEEQVVDLQERIASLHAAKLLKDDELYAIEDTVSDYIEVKAQVGAITSEICSANPVVGAMKALIALSSGMPGDAAFARQVRRKFL